ncbi:replication-relaxation family protein [Paucibacter sp. B2R-40]|uniref:replication-relaxation family protein n=1 Tax=Paucibacter sp. B2R-40 TaxID=2893554 RepID=UPI0021E3A2C4|nr:replication-relaxation family protein [Paucibacter sp. B2R-40]MCV2355402.1 replication-relaxation family protein [Paucibacter sp. B2R-40]
MKSSHPKEQKALPTDNNSEPLQAEQHTPHNNTVSPSVDNAANPMMPSGDTSVVAPEKHCEELEPVPKRPNRGITSERSTTELKSSIRLKTLAMLNRFRVMRTLDVAALCFPERSSFKASLTAAQRAVRGMVKAGLIRRYKTERFQTIYGLTQKGAELLGDAGIDAASSVRRTSDMTNPEHRLWLQFIVLASEVRGLKAQTESEVMQALNAGRKRESPAIQGLLTVEVTKAQKTTKRILRPDAVAVEVDGVTWYEIDRSKRGADREASLAALAVAVGRRLQDGQSLRRVVVQCRSERIELRALAVLRAVAKANNSEVLIHQRKHLREVEPGVFEVWGALEDALPDGRVKLKDSRLGHVIVQLLPTWLPRVRMDDRNKFSTAGWFGENYLPYRRPKDCEQWGRLTSPLLAKS